MTSGPFNCCQAGLMSWPGPCSRHSLDELIGEKDVENVTEQQAGISAREAVGQMRVALGLPAETSHADVLAEVRRLSGALVRISNALGIGPDSGVLEIVTRVRSLVSEPVTVEEVERRRAARQEALHTVLDLWSQHQWGEDPPSVDDLVLAAEWLSTGDMSAVVRVRRHAGSPDAATWTADHE